MEVFKKNLSVLKKYETSFSNSDSGFSIMKLMDEFLINIPAETDKMHMFMAQSELSELSWFVILFYL